MFTHTVTYFDFDNKERTEVLHFNLSKTDLLDDATLVERFEKMRDELSDKEEFNEKEMRILLNAVKDLMRISYGEKSDDGRYFVKEGKWEQFKASAAYDKFLLDMFFEPNKVLDFMFDIFPKDLIKEASEEVGVTPDELKAGANAPVAPELPKDERPAWIRENRKPTKQEQMSMTKEQLIEVMQRDTQSEQA